ncbi:MAG: hypothetical protein RL172_381 [Bacteroidota bacterium]|jgi:hypothetical protein
MYSRPCLLFMYNIDNKTIAEFKINNLKRAFLIYKKCPFKISLATCTIAVPKFVL